MEEGSAKDHDMFNSYMSGYESGTHQEPKPSNRNKIDIFDGDNTYDYTNEQSVLIQRR